ncbi:MAG: lytic transglycosylase domain-containing protein [Bryobacteraceae bacterium]
MRFCLEIILSTAVLGPTFLGMLGAASLPPSDGATALPNAAPGAHAVWVVKVDTRTGRLVRTLMAPAKPAGMDADVRGLVAEAAKNFDVNPLLVDSVIQVESNYNPFAVSPKGARGLMQLMPSTAQRFGVTDSFDPKQNIEAGVRYLKFLQDTFQDDRLAIAAYNAGEKAVARYKDVPPYPETVSYVAKVGKKYGQAKRAAVSSNETASVTKREAENAEEPKATSQAIEEEPRHIRAYVDAEGKLHIATR